MKIVFSDFDGTLTNSGKLGAIFFDILSLIEKNKSELVIVSGRSISWGHFLLTHFPLKHVIMEGGGVIVSRDIKGHISEEYLVDEGTIKELDKVARELQAQFPEIILSLDSFGRKTDRAIEFSEMSKDSVGKVINELDQNGVNHSKSNVHINFWLGDISKAKAIDYFLKKYTPHIVPNDCIFYGDAKNDESVFEFLPNTVGVSNILSVLDDLKFRPRVILEGKENRGALGVFSHLKSIFESSLNF